MRQIPEFRDNNSISGDRQRRDKALTIFTWLQSAKGEPYDLYGDLNEAQTEQTPKEPSYPANRILPVTNSPTQQASYLKMRQTDGSNPTTPSDKS